MLNRTRPLRFVTLFLVLIFSVILVNAQTNAERIELKASPHAEPKVEEGVIASAELVGLIESPEVASNYSFVTGTAGSLTDMSTGTAQLLAANTDDTASLLTNIGFDFYFQGVRYSQFSINDNGVLRLGVAAQAGAPYKPLAQAGLPIITAYGADQRVHTSGKVHFKVTGAVGSRVLIIEWLNNQANFNTGGTADLTYQVRLYETSGVVEFVYGSMAMSALGAADTNSRDPNIGFSSSNTAGAVGSVTAPQSGAPAPTFNGASATPVANLYTAGAITTLTSAAQGSRRIFTFTPPQTPTAPSGLSFTGVAPTSMTLNWADSPDELAYAIYNSTDGTNFSFVTSAALNATSQAVSGLAPSTNYFWRVYAISEGALSAPLGGTQATTAPANITCNGAGGNWSSPGSWTGGIPTSGDNVTVGSGCTITIDTAASAFAVTIQTGGILQFEQTNARTLTVSTHAVINSGGTLRSNAAGTQTGHNISLAGDLTNNGTLDFSTNADTAGAIITFTGAANATFGGTGATTDIRQITVNKGTTTASTVLLSPTNFTVRGVTTDTVVGGWLVQTNGTIRIGGTFAGTSRVFSAAAYTIPATAGLWLDNPNYTVAAQVGNAVNNGLFRISNGTFNQGTLATHSFRAGTGAIFTIEGGSVNCASQFSPQSPVTYTQSGGTLNVGLVGNSQSNFGTFELFATGSTFTMSNGTINVVQASTGATQIDWQNLAGTNNITGGMLNIGTGATVTKFTFNVRGNLPNWTIDNTINNKSATATSSPAQTNLRGTTLINTGTSFTINGQLCLVLANFTNNGTLIGTAVGTRFYFLGGSSATTYGGTGVVTAPLTSFEVDHTAGVIISPSVNQIVTSRVNNFAGGVTGSGKLTVGNGGSTSAVVQLGVTGVVNPITGFDVPLVFNPGTGGTVLLYAPELTGRTTGNEMPPSRTVTTLAITNPNSITIAGGDVTVNGAAAGALALGDSRVITGANTLYFNSAAGTVTRTTGRVDGNFRKSYAAIANKTFEVGTANGYSPVTVNVTVGTFPADVTVRSTQTAQPNVVDPTKALSRYWSITGTGLTADLTFNYLDPADIPGTATEGNFVIAKYSGGFTQPGGSVNTGANSATITGVTSFSDWTLAEPSALVAVADLAITKTDGVTTVVPGGSVTYTVTASNAGPDAAAGVTVADTFPAILTCSTTSTTAGGATGNNAGPFAGNINNSGIAMPAGSSVTYTSVCSISPAATGTLTNTAAVASSTSDPNAGNNSATDTDTLTLQADLAITKTDGVSTYNPGGSVTYTITASNAGPSNTTATVADTFPAAITANWTCVGAGGGTCSAGPTAGNINDAVNLPAGGSVTYTAISAISGAATGNLSNTATVTGSASDPAPGNNSATDTDTQAVALGYVVDNTSDNGTLTACTAAAADCSLRGAITNANTNPGNDTIAFDPMIFGTPQTITLGGTQMVIQNNGSLTINGTGASLLTVHGGGTSRIFNINAAAAVTMNGLTLTGGNAGADGGAILNFGTLTITDAVLSGNTSTGGGGIANNGTTNVDRCTFSGNNGGFYGGGIMMIDGGTLNVDNSTFSGNNAANGGGIGIQALALPRVATLTLRNSTISGNTTTNTSGGIGNYSDNGGISSVSISNSTITANTGPGGSGLGSGNNGGVGTIVSNTIVSSLIANNSGSVQIVNYGGATTTSQGNNLISDTSLTAVAGDLLSTDPMLGALANNGGPTQTHAPLPTSDAIDAGSNPLALTLDQRGVGFARTVGATTDIGSYEEQVTTCLPGQLDTPIVNNNGQDGNMFDITAANSVTVSSFEGNLGGNGTYYIYYKVGTHVGFENNSAAWTFIGQSSVTANPPNTLSPLPIPVNITIPAGQTYAFYLTFDAISGSNNRYHNGTATGNVNASDANIQVKEGTGGAYPFGTFFNARPWEGRVNYLTCLPTIVVNGTNGDDTLIVDATSANGGSYTLNGGPSIPLVNITSFTFNGMIGNDTLTINNPAGGLFAPTGGIDFNGGGQTGDNMNLLGGAAATETYFVGTTTPPIGGGAGNNGDGLIRYTGPALDIRFTGLAPIVDTVAVATFTQNATDAANTIGITNGGVSPRIRIAVDAFETIEINNKTNVIINGGDGAAGGDAGDSITASYSNTPAALASLTVNGNEGTDTLNAVGNVGTLDNLRYVPTGTGAGSVINDGPPQPSPLFTTIEQLQFTGQVADGDGIRVEGTTGADAISLTPGATSDSGSFTGTMNGGAFTMTPMTFYGINSASNDQDINFFNPGGTDTFVFEGTSAAETITVQPVEGGTVGITDQIGATTLIRADVYNVAFVVVNGNGAADTINVLETSAAVATTVNGGAGLDLINLGNTGTVTTPGLLTPIAGSVTVNGGADGANMTVDGSGASVNADYAISGTTVIRSTPAGFGGVTYGGLSSMLLTTGSGINVISVNGTAAGVVTNIATNAGNDAVNFADGVSLNGGTVDGGADTDALFYNAYTTPVSVNLGLSTTTMGGTLLGNQEVPQQFTTAEGTVAITNYNAVAKTFDIAVTVNNLPPADVIGFHIHRASTGTNGPIIVNLQPLAPLVAAGSGFTFSATGVVMPAIHEAGFLGGATYVNIHTAAAPGGLIRAQVFSNGNVNLASGTATGTGGVSNIETAFGGTVADSLVGSFQPNTLGGNLGNDTVLGGPGADTMLGGGGSDTLIWSNGDGSDVIDGNADADVVQVNGMVAATDVFTIGANATRVAFARTSAGPFTLDIGTAEALVVNGIGGDDTMSLNSLTGVADVSSVGLFGFDGNDTFNVVPAPNGGTRAYTVSGGRPTVFGDVLNIDQTGVTAGVLTLDAQGNGNFTSTSHQTITIFGIEPQPTTTTVASSANPSVFGQNVTFTATVAAVPPGNIPVGTVQFVIDGSNFGAPVALNGSGVATVSTAALTIGTHTVVANYSGSSSFSPSTGTLVGGQIVGKANTTTTVTAVPPSPSVFGQSVTFTATIAVVSPGVGTPTGTVSFNIDGNIYCANTPLSAGLTATCTQAGLPALPAGLRDVVAIYSGNANFNGSAGDLNYTVNKANTTTTITGDTPDPSVVGQPYTVSFTVVPNPVQVNSGTPTGSVTVSDGTGGTCSGTVAAGSCQLTSTTTGNKTLTAVYAGDNNFNTSTSAGVPHVVNVSISGTVRNGLTMAPIAGVSMSLVQLPGGASISTTTTNASGVFTFSGQFTAPVGVRPTAVAPPFYDPIIRNITSLTTNVTGQDFLQYATTADIPRNLRFVTQYVTPGDAGSMPVILNSQDNEVSVAFSITYDTNLFAQPPTFVCGAQAPGCTITHNNSVFGSVGVTIVPAGGAFARTNEAEAPEVAGLKEIARMNFQTAITANVPATTINVTGNPTSAVILNAEGNPLLWSVTPGNVVFQLGKEGDVAGRNSGNGAFEAADVVQARRFVTGLDTAVVNSANEFQRADTAPASTKGDGTLNATDVVQVRRYVASLDAAQNSGGPGFANPAPIAPPAVERSSELVVGDASATNGASISVPVRMKTNGTELATSFIVRYDERRLADPSVKLSSEAPDGVTLTVNKDEPGVIRILIDSARAFGKLDGESLIDIEFGVTNEASSGAALIEIEDLVFANAEAKATGSKAQRGTITIAGSNPINDDKGAKARDRERSGNGRSGSSRRGPDIVEEWLNPSVVILRSRIEN